MQVAVCPATLSLTTQLGGVSVEDVSRGAGNYPSVLEILDQQPGERFVDVRVVLPAKNNLPYVHWATFRLLPALLSAGVRVWYQPPPFAHTKLLAVDGYHSQIGSANLDARSLRLNFELNMEIFDPAFHGLLAGHIDTIISRSREISLEDLKRQSLPVKLRNAACWIFSPYL